MILIVDVDVQYLFRLHVDSYEIFQLQFAR